MIEPFVLGAVYVELCAERHFVELTLGALIDDRPFLAGKGRSAGFVLKEKLADFGTDFSSRKRIRATIG
jgi:hypothetical protein